MKCNKSFASKFSKSRHDARKHPEDVEGGEEDEKDEEVMEENDSTVESYKTEEVYTDNDEIESETDEDAHSVWIQVVSNVKQEYFPDTHLSQLLKDPIYGTFLKKLRKHVHYRIHMAKVIKNSSLMKKILDREDQLYGDGFGRTEANKKAWEDRKFAVKAFIKKNMHDKEEEETEENDIPHIV
jgi:hypothetical protein